MQPRSSTRNKTVWVPAGKEGPWGAGVVGKGGGSLDEWWKGVESESGRAFKGAGISVLSDTQTLRHALYLA